MAPQQLVVVSGFTAAGKTTHSRLLARELGWDYIGMSQVRRLLIPASSSLTEEWRAEGDGLRAADAGLDRQMDQGMAELIAKAESPLVVDAWLQPWLCEASQAVRVWLGSSFESRVLKADVTWIRYGRPGRPRDIRRQVQEKDRFSIRHFERLYGIRFGPDPHVFDVILDNSSFITESSIPASDKGIAEFHRVFSGRIQDLLPECTEVP